METVLEIVQKYFELIIEWAVLLCELIGVVMIVLTAIRGVIAWIRKNPHARLIAAEGIAIALTFKMGGEVLRTVIVRDWQELLILGAVVLLRVVMAVIIHFEIRSERQILGDEPGETPTKTPEEVPEGQPVEPPAPKKKPPIIRL
ncbi:MAG: DUF1622 domain-containing protein [Clostridia bacterium]|nr:DUF1622 domain-containing protein [Clostridia bacterium]